MNTLILQKNIQTESLRLRSEVRSPPPTESLTLSVELFLLTAVCPQPGGTPPVPQPWLGSQDHGSRPASGCSPHAEQTFS